MRSPFSLALIVCLLSVAACGQKGPLYLPGDPSEMKTEIPPQNQPRPEEEEDEEENNN